MTKEQIIRDYLSTIGRKGGAAGKGERKSRVMGREHYDKVSRAQRERWASWRLKNGRPALDRER